MVKHLYSLKKDKDMTKLLLPLMKVVAIYSQSSSNTRLTYIHKILEYQKSLNCVAWQCVWWIAKLILLLLYTVL